MKISQIIGAEAFGPVRPLPSCSFFVSALNRKKEKLHAGIRCRRAADGLGTDGRTRVSRRIYGAVKTFDPAGAAAAIAVRA